MYSLDHLEKTELGCVILASAQVFLPQMFY